MHPQEPSRAETQDAQEESLISTDEKTEAGPDREAEILRLKDQMLRAAAEAENIRKRSQREVEETAKYAVSSLARDMVGAVENLHRALESIPAEGREASPLLANLRTGVEMTLEEMTRALEKHGVKRIYPLGLKFDHNFHQAVAQIDATDAEPGTVVQVLQAGYTIHDRLLRPAMVGVARASETAKIVDTIA